MDEFEWVAGAVGPEADEFARHSGGMVGGIALDMEGRCAREVERWQWVAFGQDDEGLGGSGDRVAVIEEAEGIWEDEGELLEGDHAAAEW